MNGILASLIFGGEGGIEPKPVENKYIEVDEKSSNYMEVVEDGEQ